MTNIVRLPKPKRSPYAPKTDADLAADVTAAWRKLHRTIQKARQAGLAVDVNIDSVEPRVTKKLT